MEAVQEGLGGLVQEAQEAVTHVVVVTVSQVDQAVALGRGLLAEQQVQLPAETSEAWLRVLVSPALTCCPGRPRSPPP